jgi:hypothetical protein
MSIFVFLAVYAVLLMAIAVVVRGMTMFMPIKNIPGCQPFIGTLVLTLLSDLVAPLPVYDYGQASRQMPSGCYC